MRSTPVMDARVRKTQRRLREALVWLIHEKSYDAIVVNEILERAEVGRSAFYTHFSNKDELLARASNRSCTGIRVASLRRRLALSAKRCGSASRSSNTSDSAVT